MRNTLPVEAPRTTCCPGSVMSLSSALETLANYRAHSSRASHDIVEKGKVVLNSKAVSKLGDEAWSFLEQLALAAIDTGDYDLADECLGQLGTKFPESPRVDILTGIRMEATERPELALKFYDDLLEVDSSNAAAYKRRISILVRIGKVEQAVSELSEYLDTFYSDLEGWVELAELYSSCNQLRLSPLLETQFLTNETSVPSSQIHFGTTSPISRPSPRPQNPFYVLQFAETAYTADDIPLAIKMFMLAVDIADRHASEESVPTGASIRAWYGIKLVSISSSVALILNQFN
ncbi:hypothetical protein D9757_000977 [Collybiopsis confluens]|uniref:ER membrane protein complex subunit 2 n=1 Tax=Collybiopsis confluens TaxID=2823264 RepID=A0A8H5I0B2_9AGAR|nr:hypothetical protein D9757_000977 [Collybiopsis confluens]